MEETAGAKALRLEHALLIGETARSPVWLEESGEGENGGFELQERRQGARRAAARVPFPRGRQKPCGGGTGGTQVFTESLQAAGTRAEQGAGEEMEADPRGGGGKERRRPPHPGAPRRAGGASRR